MSVKREKKQEQLWLRPVLRVTVGGVLAVAVSVGILTLLAWVMSMGVLGRQAEGGCVVAAATLGTILGGLYVTARCERGRLLAGAGVGVVALLVYLTIGALCLGGVTGVGEMRGVGLGCLLGGLVAGVLPALRTGKSRRRK